LTGVAGGGGRGACGAGWGGSALFRGLDGAVVGGGAYWTYCGGGCCTGGGYYCGGCCAGMTIG